MTGSEVWLRDQRLAPLAVSAFPAWLWSVDGAHILWANPTGAAMFGADPAMALAARKFDPGEPAALQVAELAATLKPGDVPRIERLRGFGSGVGRGLTCACSHVKIDDGTAAILLVAAERAGPELSLAERVHRLLAGAEAAIAAFAADGTLIEATGAAQARLQGKASLAALGADQLMTAALSAGHAAGENGDDPIELRRIGAEAQPILIATFPACRAREETAPVAAISSATSTPAPVSAVPAAPRERRHPLRFVWQMDAEGRFTLGSDEFIALIGPQTARRLDQPWTDMSTVLRLDPDDHVTHAVATQETWSGLTVSWPVDDSRQRLTVELSGLPIFDRDRAFRGYRGFGVCRDVAALNALAALRRSGKPAAAEPPVSDEAAAAPAPAPAEAGTENIVPFRPPSPPEAPSLTPVERRAFRELTRRLTSRLTEAGVEYKGANDQELQHDGIADPTLTDLADAAKAATTPLTGESSVAAPSLDEEIFQPHPQHPEPAHGAAPLPSTATPISILDRLPIGLLIYRHSELLYANRAFLASTGYANLDALSEAGGLDSLFIGPDAIAADAAGGGKTFALAGQGGDQVALEGRLIVVPWDGDSAFALVTTPIAARAQQAAPAPAQDEAAELRSILDTATDGVIVLDPDGRILSASRSSEALFGYEARELIGRAFTSLFAPESERIASDYLERLKKNGVASVLNDGREVIGRVRQGGLIPLFMTLGRIDGPARKFCAVLRDITPWKKAEEELIESKRRSEKTSAGKADFLAKVSHEIRTPLNAIIGFSEVMMDERFGPVGNERYREYLRDIYASGGHVIALVDDLLALSKIEAGTLELAFTSVALNELIQQCVAAMQPQANKERIIIRTSLPPKLPPVMADEGALRQIVTNLLTHSIRLSAAGGQIIVSTALTDAGEVALRVRDTGIGMSETEIANALEPFRSLAVSGRWGVTGLGLPLSKALAKANRANFQIRSKPKEGTLVEVVFPAARVFAGP